MSSDPFRSEESVKFTGDNLGDFLLNILTVGLYNQPNLIIREYIQNSHDAICDWQQSEPGRVDIQISWPNIHIFDNGPGMNQSELVNAMSNFGKSFKTMSAGSGFMGIGKLAGISMASRVEIHSSKYGVPEKNWVAFESSEMLTGIMERRIRGEHHSILETLNQHIKVNKEPLPEEKDAHYTSVHLLNVNEDYRAKIEDEIGFAKSIGLIAPVIQDPKFDHAPTIEKKLLQAIPENYKPIDIYINGKPVYRPYVTGLSEPETIMVLDDDDNTLAYGWACLHTESERYKRQIPDSSLQGIAFMQRGIAIGNRSLAEEMGIFSSTSNPIYFRWYSGELYIVDPKIIVSSDRTRIRENKHTFDFVEKVSKEFRRLAKIASTWANQDNAEVVVQESIQKVKKIEEQVKVQPLTSDTIPRILSELGKTQDNINKRKKYVVKQETKSQADEVEKKVGTILDQIATAQRNKNQLEQDDMLSITTFMEEKSADVLHADTQEQLPFADVLSGETTNVLLRDIPERLSFSPRETQIYRIIMQAIADACEGRSSERFMKIALAVETALSAALSDQRAEVL